MAAVYFAFCFVLPVSCASSWRRSLVKRGKRAAAASQRRNVKNSSMCVFWSLRTRTSTAAPLWPATPARPLDSCPLECFLTCISDCHHYHALFVSGGRTLVRRYEYFVGFLRESWVCSAQPARATTAPSPSLKLCTFSPARAGDRQVPRRRGASRQTRRGQRRLTRARLPAALLRHPQRMPPGHLHRWASLIRCSLVNWSLACCTSASTLLSDPNFYSFCLFALQRSKILGQEECAKNWLNCYDLFTAINFNLLNGIRFTVG